MKEIFKSKKEVGLWVSALVLLLFLISYTIYSISFLGSNINDFILGGFTGGGETIKFDFDGFNKILPQGDK